jgi:hypothetical protein
MKSPKEIDAGGPVVFEEDDLLRLEIQVAKRADALALSTGGRTLTDLEHWLQAEHEVFGEKYGRDTDLLSHTACG